MDVQEDVKGSSISGRHPVDEIHKFFLERTFSNIYGTLKCVTQVYLFNHCFQISSFICCKLLQFLECANIFSLSQKLNY